MANLRKLPGVYDVERQFRILPVYKRVQLHIALLATLG